MNFNKVNPIVLNAESKAIIGQECYLNVAKNKMFYMSGNKEIYISESDEKLLIDKMTLFSNNENKEVEIESLNIKRTQELNKIVIDDIAMNEDVIKTMAVQFNIADDTETIQWIDINNQVVEFNKVDFGALIKQGSMKVKEIYFKYRTLKDQVV